MDLNDDETSASLLTYAVIGAGVVAGLLILMMKYAPAHEVCLSKAEARKLWPKQHIFWYSKDHCWSNRRGPPRGLKIDYIPPEAKAEAPPRKDANGNPRAIIKVVRAEDYNELDAQADQDVFFNATPFPYWAHVMDVDLSRYKTWYERVETWR